ncbi:MAG TPA: hypothetical protein VE396_15330 [Xanthobacteraceae bacterium]|jgi:hypothetical protein|nr:hypothetical protein [Xanthobacteraceae bacterium]
MESGILSSLENLTHFGFRDGVDMRPTLIRVLTDLYVQKLTHTIEEKRHYTELALRLLDAVDVATRVAVAGRLARHMSPPVRVIARLAADVPEVAALVRSHPVRQPKPRETAPVIPDAPAARGPEPVKPREVPLPVAPHLPPRLPPRRTEPERPAAAAAATITPEAASELNELFFAASADERRLILLNLHIAAPMPAGRVGVSRETVVIQRLEAAALARNREDFSAYLGQSLRIPRAQARRIAGDDLGEPIVAAAKAINMPRDVLYRILLFVNTTIGHSVARVHALAALYDEMTVQAAEHMVAIWQALHNSESASGTHQPLTRDEEARAQARTATATVCRAPAARRANERRDVS